MHIIMAACSYNDLYTTGPVGRRGSNSRGIQRKWRAIRDRFVRELKKINSSKSGNSGRPYAPTWSLFDVLSFLMDTET